MHRDVKFSSSTGESLWHFPLSTVIVTMDREELDKITLSFNNLTDKKSYECIKFLQEILIEVNKGFEASDS